MKPRQVGLSIPDLAKVTEDRHAAVDLAQDVLVFVERWLEPVTVQKRHPAQAAAKHQCVRDAVQQTVGARLRTDFASAIAWYWRPLLLSPISPLAAASGVAPAAHHEAQRDQRTSSAPDVVLNVKQVQTQCQQGAIYSPTIDQMKAVPQAKGQVRRVSRRDS